MRNFLIFALVLTSLQPALSQSIFIPRTLECPGSKTLDRTTQLVDMDNDGDLDLIGKELYLSDIMLVYRNEGGILNTEPVVAPLPTGIKHIGPNTDFGRFLLHDWNLDGLPDLIGRQDDALYWVENLGGMAFGQAVQIGPANLLNSLGQPDIHDFNGDQLPDIALLTQESLTIRFISHDGSDLTTIPLFTPPQYAGEIEHFDFDGDGLLDFAISRHVNLWVSDLLLYRNTGNLQYQLTDTIAANLYLSDLQFIDLDGTAPPELVYRRNTSDSLFYSKWEPFSQQFSSHFIGLSRTVPFGQFQANILPADLNGDGLMDIVSDNVAFFQQVNGIFNKVQFIPDPQRADNTSMGDTDSDGLLEVWFRGNRTFSPPIVYRVEYAGNDTFQSVETIITMYPSHNSQVQVFDADNNNQPDIFFETVSEHFVLSLNDQETFTEQYVAGINASLNEVKVDDLDGDGLKDLLFVNYATGQTPPHHWSKNIGNGQFQFMGQITFTGVPINPFVHGLKDLDNDGLPDIFSLWRSGDLIRWSSFKNTGNGTFSFVDGEDMESYFDFNGVELNFHDVNSDGFEDIVLFYKSGGNQVRILHNDDGTGFTEIQRQALGNPINWYGLADVTNDGRKDILYALVPGNNFAPNVENYLVANVDGTFSPPVKLRDLTVQPAQDFFLQDINNDGLDDLITQNYGFQVALNTGAGFGPLQDQNGGYNLDRKTPFVDFDGDGDLDWFQMQGKMLLWENLSVSSYRVAGLIFFDKNGNGVQDPGEPPFPAAKVGIEALSAYTISDSSGYFNLPVGSNGGTFEVGSLSDLNPYLTFTTPYPALASISNTYPADTVFIGVQVQGGVQSRVEQTLGGYRCGQQTRHWVSFTSIAPVTVAGELTLRVPPGIQVLDIDSLPGVVAQGQEIRWLFDSLPALSVTGVWADVRMPLSGTPGDTLPFFVELHTWAGGDTATTLDTLTQILRCSFDPNDKQITNSERFMEGDHLFTVTDQVEYTIRFQNTGNDTAFQVVIRDILPLEFDPASVQFLTGSHPYRAVSDANGSLTVEFPGIRLPDSTANFTGSMGYVKFRAILKASANRAQDIQNGARIYFDYNAPVYTNIAVFQRVECNYFTQIEASKQKLCGNAENSIPVPNFGVNQQYQWFWDDVLVSTDDTARFFIPTIGQHLLRLSVTNKLCQIDTIASINLLNELPELALNIQEDTTVCAPITLSSAVYCSWNDGINPMYAQNFTVVQIGQSVVAVSAGSGHCVARDTILVEYLDPGNWQAVDQNPIFQYVCPEEELQLYSIFNQHVIWSIYHPDGQSFQQTENPLQLSGDTLQGPYFIILSTDTLNCTINGYTDIEFLAKPAILQQTNVLTTQNGQPATWYFSTAAFAPFDSVAYGTIHSNLETGYYFIREIKGACDMYSDTVYIQITKQTEAEQEKTMRAWFDFRNAELFIEGALVPGARLRVKDATGRLIIDTQLSPRQRLSDLPDGVYFLLLQNGAQVKNIKIMVRRI